MESPFYRLRYIPLFKCEADGVTTALLHISFRGNLQMECTDETWAWYTRDYTSAVQRVCRMIIWFDVSGLSGMPPMSVVARMWDLVMRTRKYTTTRVPLVIVETAGMPALADVVNKLINMAGQAVPYFITPEPLAAAAKCFEVLAKTEAAWRAALPGTTPLPPKRSPFLTHVLVLLVYTGIIAPNFCTRHDVGLSTK
jgi:hypothetical protein